MTSSSLLTIPIDRLRVGMFVAKLDISWLDSPFLSHSRLIKKEDDISALLSSGVKQVVVDLSKGRAPMAEEHAKAQILAPEPIVTEPAPTVAKPAERLVASEATTLSGADDCPKPSKTEFTQELEAAYVLRSKIRQSVENIHRSLELNVPVDIKELVPLIDTALDSLSRNDQALMTLVNLSRTAQCVADHVFGTFCLTLNLALTLNIPPAQREQLALAALLHEAGWVQLPLNLMGKRAPYTAAEQALIVQHTLLGQNILKNSQLSALSLRIIGEHHERLDGSGYPQGLQQDQIHGLSQLLSVVDVYEERVHQLTDQPGMVPINAMRSLYHDAQKGYLDEKTVAAFISMVGVYPATTAVALSTSEKAVVVHNHADAPLAPVIEIHYDSRGKPMDAPLRVDLHRQGSYAQRAINKAIDPGVPGVDPAGRLVISEHQLG